MTTNDHFCPICARPKDCEQHPEYLFTVLKRGAKVERPGQRSPKWEWHTVEVIATSMTEVSRLTQIPMIDLQYVTRSRVK